MTISSAIILLSTVIWALLVTCVRSPMAVTSTFLRWPVIDPRVDESYLHGLVNDPRGAGGLVIDPRNTCKVPLMITFLPLRSLLLSCLFLCPSGPFGTALIDTKWWSTILLLPSSRRILLPIQTILVILYTFPTRLSNKKISPLLNSKQMPRHTRLSKL